MVNIDFMSPGLRLTLYFGYLVFFFNLIFSLFAVVAVGGLGALYRGITFVTEVAPIVFAVSGLTGGYGFGLYAFFTFHRHEKQMFHAYGLAPLVYLSLSYFENSCIFVASALVVRTILS